MFKIIFNKYKYQFLLFLIASILFLVNHRSGTYLTGWDNLQTELNPGLAVKRAFFSVWEEYQSFGLTAGMAHAADLPRAIFLWVTSFVIPQNMIRYFYHFLMLLLGGLGAFSLFKKTSAVKNLQYTEQTAEVKSEVGAFLGALFYMINLGTVQIFYLPYEAFSTFFALLPWGIWIFSKILDNGTMEQSNNWKLFFLINILGTPTFYTQQLFIVYMMVLGCVAIGSLTTAVRHGQNQIKTAAVSTFFGFALILIINSFWLLPQFYFLKTNSKVVTEAKNNTISTENVFYQNYEKGTIGNFIRLEGFYFDLKGKDNTFLFAPWKDHFGGIFGIFPYVFALLMIIGILKTIKEKSVGFLFVYLFCMTGLLIATPPFSWINELIRKIPVINQIFRSPFTKFIIPYSLVYSYFVAKGLQSLVTPMAKKKFVNLFLVSCFLFVITYSLPSFQGYFFSPEMKVNIPEDYHSVINYFKSEGKNSRIALLPDYTFWGWFFNKWGYNGSGFIWYGIEQPIVSRTFDVWSKASESYFWESKTAFESEDINKLMGVFEKYQIDYLLLDKSLIPVVSSYKALQYDRINDLLIKSSMVTPIFSGENVFLYKINHTYPSKNYVSLVSNLTNVSDQDEITNNDQAFTENGFYVNDKNVGFDVVYPFSSLTSQTKANEKSWQISEDGNYFYLVIPLDINFDQFQLFFNDSYDETVLINDIPTKVLTKIESNTKNETLTIRFSKKIIKNYNVNLDQSSDFYITDNTLSQNIGYLLKTKSINKQGLPLFFYIVDQTKKQSYLEDRLDKPVDYFIIQPRYNYGLGYTFTFQNKSFKNLPASNNLEELSLYLFPYQALKELKFVKTGINNKSQVNFLNNFDTIKNNYFTYSVKIDQSGQDKTSNLILYQSYSPGWIALQNGKFLPHIKINNWANGWQLDNQLTHNSYSLVTILFWPQYLEFLGFGLMIVAFNFILKFSPKDPQSVS